MPNLRIRFYNLQPSSEEIEEIEVQTHAARYVTHHHVPEDNPSEMLQTLVGDIGATKTESVYFNGL